VEHTAAAPPKVALWNNPAFRALLYQAIVLSACVAAIVFFFVNTFNNLKQRGISSGFGFLSNEAGFGISEVISIPRLENGFLVFLLTVALCIAAAWGLSAAFRRKGRALGDSLPGLGLGLAVLVGIPALVLFATAGSFTAETYTEASNYRIALLTGLLNTLKLSAIACVLATFLTSPAGAALGVPSLPTIADVSTCIVLRHECRLAQMLENQLPRTRELIEIAFPPGSP